MSTVNLIGAPIMTNFQGSTNYRVKVRFMFYFACKPILCLIGIDNVVLCSLNNNNDPNKCDQKINGRGIPLRERNRRVLHDVF